MLASSEKDGGNEMKELKILSDDKLELKAKGFVTGRCKPEWRWIAQAQLDADKKVLGEILGMFQVATVVPSYLPDTVWLSMSYSNYKTLFPEGKLIKSS